MAERRVGVLGAGGFVGRCLLERLRHQGWEVIACHSRQREQWPRPEAGKTVELWISVTPVWALPDSGEWLEAWGARRVVALSSTSVVSKRHSADREEARLAERLDAGESWLRKWGEAKGIEWVILRPTLIYGRGGDRNVCDIARFIRRFGCFPVLGSASGMRQPVHVEDVADACLSALASRRAAGKVYSLSGGDMLSYRDMVLRVFAALDRRPLLIGVPLWAFRLGAALVRLLPRCRHWKSAMAERMALDLVFDHSAAARDLGFAPRSFRPRPEDLETREAAEPFPGRSLASGAGTERRRELGHGRQAG